MIIDESDYLAHYGVIRRSGRYPWGSGGNVNKENQRNWTFLDNVEDLRSRGWKEKDIAKGLGVSISELRARQSNDKNARKSANIRQAQELFDKGWSKNAIANHMGAPESTVRQWLKPGAEAKATIAQTTAKMLRDQVDEKKFLDIGSGVENHIGVTSTALGNAVSILKGEGYTVHQVKVEQLGTGHETNMKILALPGTTWGDVQRNRGNIQQITNFSDDNGRNFYGLHPPIKINPRRVGINYKEDHGDEADGVIYVRPGVDDISLGGSRYAQVRIAVGEGHYLKGMAIYKDDLPDGVDLVFNTNKSDTGNKFDAMKKIEDDPENPFGSIVRQIVKNPGSPKEQVTSAMNIVGGRTDDPNSGNIEGNWGGWSKTLSSQMLSKQNRTLAKSQLDMTYERREQEFENIMALTNPTVRKRLLHDFAESTDAAAVHLKAAGLPRQGTHVILPVSTISPSQVYAPNYKDGERVVLIRHPHGGTFEIPELTVNNKHAESKKLLGDSRDAIGIHHSVAARLSGADFDGDTVLVIPNNNNRVSHRPALEDLKNFDPRSAYPAYEGMKRMANTQTEMGKISNLITDMSLQGASDHELARAIKHSMVVIDAEKHNLDHRASANDNGIKALKKKYQTGGASTLISRAGAEVRIPDRKLRPQSQGGPIDKKTGEKVWVNTNKKSYKTGKTIQTTVERLALESDAHVLSAGHPMERLYADHSNKLKKLANSARLAEVNTPPTKYNASAKETYKKEVDSLNASLALAKRNRPLERQAQILANNTIRLRRDSNPNMDGDTLNKIKAQALNEARNRTGAAAVRITISPNEWDAIQAGAISDSKLNEILMNADMDVVRNLATPHESVLMTPTKTSRAATMLASGYTRSEVAEALGVSVSTLDKATVSSE